MPTVNHLLSNPVPVNKSALYTRLREILALGWQEMPKGVARYNGTGGPGNFLEDLIGLKAGNQDIADVLGWEVKYYTPQSHLITLFHKEAGPFGIMRYMVSKHGWKDKENRLSFRHTIHGRSDRFEVVNDAGQIIVRPLKGNGPVPVWTHDDLLNAAGKLKRLLLVKGERKGQQVRFIHADCFENLHLTLFVAEMVNGTIVIDFDAREAKPGSAGLRNHGTKFRIKPQNICRIYLKKERFY
ncbi:MAG: MvaI/BcnI family restriction endonuclease [Pyrinomonadaceae bacterium]